MCKKSRYCKESGKSTAFICVIVVLIIGVPLLISACSARVPRLSEEQVHPATASCTLTSPVFPESGFVEGWRMSEKPAFYYKDTLFNRVDGEAELYFPYGFVCLASAFYTYGNDEQRGMYVDIFKMGSKLDAFGIYSNYRFPSAEFIAVGNEGFVTRNQLLYYKERFFVRIDSSGDETRIREVMISAARWISKNLEKCQAVSGYPTCDAPESRSCFADTAKSVPPEIALLQSPRLVVRTERYLPSGILGSSLLSPALLARYSTSESEVTGFVVIFCSPQQARDAFVSYKKFRALKGEIAETPGKISEEGYTVTDKYHGRIILCFYKKYIFGIYDIRTDVQERDARSIILDIAEALKSGALTQ